MFFVCAKEDYIKLDKYFCIYLGFILFYVIASANTGFLSEAFSKCIGYYLVCYVAYQSTKCLINKYDSGVLLVYILLVIGVFDAIVTIFQFMGDSRAFDVFETLCSKGSSDKLLDSFSSKGSLSGYVMPGIVGGVVNGYFLSSMCALAFYQKESELKLMNLALALLFLIALFMVQERTGAVVGALIVLYLFSKQFKKKINFGVLFVLIFAFIYVFPIISDYVFNDQSRYANMSLTDNVRSDFLRQTIEYLEYNPLGSIDDYRRFNKFPPHNLVLNAFVYAGIFGGPFILVLLIVQTTRILPTLLSRITKSNQMSVLFGFVYMAYTLNSLMHNSSLVTGDSMFWVSWAVFLCNRPQKYFN